MADLDAAWTRLEAAAKAAGDKRIVEFFDAEPGRLDALTLDVAGLHLDLSKLASSMPARATAPRSWPNG